MHARLIAAAIIIATGSAAHADQIKQPVLTPSVICPDGTDPNITGRGCTAPKLRNAIDEGLTSSVPRIYPQIVVPNDPLGRSVGGGTSMGTTNPGGFGNPAIQLK